MSDSNVITSPVVDTISRTTSVVGGVGAPSIGEVMESVDKVAGAAGDFVANAEDLVTQGISLSEKKVDAIETIGANKTVVAKQQAAATLAADAQIRELFQAAGGADTLLRMSKAQLSATDTLLKEQAELDENIRHNSSGPIDFIANAFSQAFNVEDVNQAASSLGNINQAIAGLAATTEANAKVLNQTAITRTKATMAALQDNILQDTIILASDAELAALKDNALAVEGVLRANSAVFDATLAGFKAGATQEGLDQRKKEYELTMKRLKFQMERALKDDITAGVRLKQAEENLRFSLQTNPGRAVKAELELKEAQEGAERAATAREQLAIGIKRGRAILGLPDITAETAISQYAIDPKTNLNLFAIGAEGSDVAGADTAEVLINMLSNNPELMAQTTNPVLSLYNDVKDDLETRASAPGAGRLNKQQLSAQLNSVSNAKLDEFAEKINMGDTNNPYLAPPMPVLMEAEVVKATPFYQKVLKGINPALTDTNPQQLMDLGMAAIADKVATIEEVSSGIATIFETAGALNTARHMFVRYGVGPQTTYFATARKAGALGGSNRAIDYADVTEVKTHLVHNLSSLFNANGIFGTNFTGLGFKTFELLAPAASAVSAASEELIKPTKE